MPLIMTAERRETVIAHLKQLYSSRSSYAYELSFNWSWMKQVIEAFDAEHAARQETQAKLAATLAYFDNAFGLQMQSMLAVVERDSAMKQEVRSLQTQLAELDTESKLKAHFYFESEQKHIELAETQAIVLELVEALNTIVDLRVRTQPCDGRCEGCCECIARSASAKAKRALSASGDSDAPVSGEGQ